MRRQASPAGWHGAAGAGNGLQGMAAGAGGIRNFAQIKSGERPPGSRLPTIMQLPEEHGVATATVTKALRILKREGLVIGSTGDGTFVAERAG